VDVLAKFGHVLRDSSYATESFSHLNSEVTVLTFFRYAPIVKRPRLPRILFEFPGWVDGFGRHLAGFAAIFVALILASGCASTPIDETWKQNQTSALRERLLQLDDSVDAKEAARLAEVAVRQSAELALEYRAIRPAWLNNWFVNAGWRERGLCYEWANDLFPVLHELGLQSLELHLAVSRMDTKHEHNSIVVTALRQPFMNGLVLDAWRHSGRLWFGNAATDVRHPWQPLPRDRVAPELEEFIAN